MAYRRYGVLAVAVIVGLALTLAPAFATERASDDGRIAFASDRDGDFDIWSVRPNGRGLVNLTADSEALDFGLSWRPDGRKLAFMSDRVTPTNPGPDVEIFVMNADGSRVQQLTANSFDDDYPSWSPDGRRLVFARDFDPAPMEFDYDLFTMWADGSHQRNLTNSPGFDDWHGDWSPDGRRIVFESDRDGDPEVYTMRPDGSGVRQLTVNSGPEDRNPAWSPDGRRIAFDSDRDGEFEIYRMRADGSDQTRLTFNVAYQSGAAWSPDGRKITFHRDRDENIDVYTMRADGSDQARLTRHPALDWYPDWQALPERHY